VLSVLALAAAAGAPLPDAAILANAAAGVAVSKLGTATVAPEELNPRPRRNSRVTGRELIMEGKLKDFSSVFIHTVTTRVLRLFSPSVGSGIGENGLTATSTTMLLIEPSGRLIFMIL